MALYKHGTLLRRIERRMTLASLKAEDYSRYLELLEADKAELEQLGRDLLIHVTKFFRDSPIFEKLASDTIPALLEERRSAKALRIWVAGCSTGEEAYSLAILFLEAKSNWPESMKVQIFASDVDGEAIAAAREGFYTSAAASSMSPERLSRYFTRDEGGVRVAPELREMVVFTVHDILTDPPFSRLDLISCRNVLIYLSPIAQRKVIARFHFALNPGGLLLLGSAEAVASDEAKFEIVSKSQRLYRRTGIGRRADKELLGDILYSAVPSAGPSAGHRTQSTLEDHCQQKLMEIYAPAAVLVNHADECLFSMGPTERFLSVPKGAPTNDLFAMLHSDIRPHARRALYAAREGVEPASATASLTGEGGQSELISVEVHPLTVEGEHFMLVCLAVRPVPEAKAQPGDGQPDSDRVVHLELQLQNMRRELELTAQSMEASNEEHRSIAEEAMSTNEEFQAANEELLTSKEELQSLNEELTALNGQMQEALEKQRTTSNDLQNVLNSTNVATLFLDRDLNIRFFTPVTRKLFNIIPSDIGRPLADLNSLVTDDGLLTESRMVLSALSPVEREIQTGIQTGTAGAFFPIVRTRARSKAS